jgi:catechol 2,3-dioxygenase-like lactoylglutathione lyase family enzyme
MMRIAKDSLDLGVVVSNIQDSLMFYKNTLGLEYVGETPIWFGVIRRLRYGNSDLKLIDPHKLPPKGLVGLDRQLGFRYVTFAIKNLSSFCTLLQSKGIKFVLSEKEIRPGVRIAMVEDPDGNIVEFVEKT